MTERILDVVDLTAGFTRNGVEIRPVDGVSFHVDANETLGIVGESGCGKTTTGLAILRLLPPRKGQTLTGQVLLEGRDILKMSEREVRQIRGRKISKILQDPMTSLNPVLKIGEQIMEAISAHGRLDRKSLLDRAIDALRLVNISAPASRVDNFPHQISGGMRQRVVGAIALSCRPRLLIADEPTTSLDVTVQAQYLALLRDLQRELGMSMMFITHDFGVVARMCNRVCVMYAGKIVETAPVREIFRRPAHGYTAALIGGMPKLDSRPQRLVSIAGQPPKLDNLPRGCRFAPRCAMAQKRCHEDAPPMVSVGEAHQVSCWNPWGRM